jgi:hypothetical protein
MQNSHDLDEVFAIYPVQEEMTSATTVSCDMERAETSRDLVPPTGPDNIRAIGKLSDRMNAGISIDSRLPRAEILCGPLEDVYKIEFGGGAEAHAPFGRRHELFDSVGDDLLGEAV